MHRKALDAGLLPDHSRCCDPGTIDARQGSDRPAARVAFDEAQGPRPPFNFPGAWLYSGDQPVLHLNDIAGTDRQQHPDSGVIDHVAFMSRGFEATKQHLNAKGIAHRVNQVPNSTRWQIFLRDPNNVEIELNFETKNELAG